MSCHPNVPWRTAPSSTRRISVPTNSESARRTPRRRSTGLTRATAPMNAGIVGISHHVARGP